MRKNSSKEKKVKKGERIKKSIFFPKFFPQIQENFHRNSNWENNQNNQAK